MTKINNFDAVSYQVTANTCFQGFAFGAHQADCLAEQTPQRVVLFLHGWLDNAASFSLLFEQLQLLVLSKGGAPDNSLTNTLFVAIDLAGHGLSSHRSLDAHYHFHDWVYDLLLLLEHNQWLTVDLVGHSMGGMIASMFAAAFPERTRSLTLIDSLGYFTSSAKNTSSQLRKGMKSRLHLMRKTLATDKATNELPRSKKSRAYPSIKAAVHTRVSFSDINKHHAQLIVERGLIEQPQGFYWRHDLRLKNTSLYRMSKAQAEQLLQDIQAPVLLIYGDKGHPMVPNALTAFKKVHQSMNIYRLVGGHHIHMEQATKTAQYLYNFLLSL